MLKTLLLTQAACSLVMVGVIWFVQLVHYPLYLRVGDEHFRAYQKYHVTMTTWIVGPAMLGELLAGVALVCADWTGTALSESGRAAAWIALGWLALALGVTAFWSAPAHGVLEKGFDPAAHRRLVSTNWVRTLAWSARGALAVWMLARMLP